MIKKQHTELPTITIKDICKLNYSFSIYSLDDPMLNLPFLSSPHTVEFYILLFFEKGEGIAEVDDQKIKLENSIVVFINPNSIFKLTLEGIQKGKLICFSNTFYSLRYNENNLFQFHFVSRNQALFRLLAASMRSKWKHILKFIEVDFTERDIRNNHKIRSYLNILLQDLEQLTLQSSKELSTKKSEKFLQFEELLELHYMNHKNPTYYAEKLHITTNYLNRICKNNRHKSCIKLIQERVVLEAERHLHYTTLSVAEIGYKLGFKSPSYFIDFFKRNTSTTPVKFRRTV